MMPPISGMQAIAAATFEGNPVDVDFGPGSGPGAGAGAGGVGSWSGMIYIHEMPVGLSSNLGFSFPLSLSMRAKYHAFLTHQTNDQKFLLRARLHPHRDGCGPSGHRHYDGLRISRVRRHVAGRETDKRLEQPSPDG